MAANKAEQSKQGSTFSLKGTVLPKGVVTQDSTVQYIIDELVYAYQLHLSNIVIDLVPPYSIITDCKVNHSFQGAFSNLAQ
jgi:hypothetical protein